MRTINNRYAREILNIGVVALSLLSGGLPGISSAESLFEEYLRLENAEFPTKTDLLGPWLVIESDSQQNSIAMTEWEAHKAYQRKPTMRDYKEAPPFISISKESISIFNLGANEWDNYSSIQTQGNLLRLPAQTDHIVFQQYAYRWTESDGTSFYELSPRHEEVSTTRGRQTTVLKNLPTRDGTIKAGSVATLVADTSPHSLFTWIKTEGLPHSYFVPKHALSESLSDFPSVDRHSVRLAEKFTHHCRYNGDHQLVCKVVLDKNDATPPVTIYQKLTRARYIYPLANGRGGRFRYPNYYNIEVVKVADFGDSLSVPYGTTPRTVNARIGNLLDYHFNSLQRSYSLSPFQIRLSRDGTECNAVVGRGGTESGLDGFPPYDTWNIHGTRYHFRFQGYQTQWERNARPLYGKPD